MRRRARSTPGALLGRGGGAHPAACSPPPERWPGRSGWKSPTVERLQEPLDQHPAGERLPVRAAPALRWQRRLRPGQLQRRGQRGAALAQRRAPTSTWTPGWRRSRLRDPGLREAGGAELEHLPAAATARPLAGSGADLAPRGAAGRAMTRPPADEGLACAGPGAAPGAARGGGGAGLGGRAAPRSRSIRARGCWRRCRRSSPRSRTRILRGEPASFSSDALPALLAELCGTAPSGAQRHRGGASTPTSAGHRCCRPRHWRPRWRSAADTRTSSWTSRPGNAARARAAGGRTTAAHRRRGRPGGEQLRGGHAPGRSLRWPRTARWWSPAASWWRSAEASAFRDVMRQSHATLVEVGTTNRTRRADYERRAQPARRPLVTKVHRSNFALVGFTEDTSVEELARPLPAAGVASVRRRRQRPPGSARRRRGSLPSPPCALTSRRARDLVAFSGTKLARVVRRPGMVVGRAGVDRPRLRSHPLARALRIDKLTVAALRGDAPPHTSMAGGSASPTLAMVEASEPARAERARHACSRRLLADAGIHSRGGPGRGAGRGGTLPLARPTLRASCAGWRRRGASGRDSAPVTRRCVARIDEGRVLLDVRCVSDAEAAGASPGAVAAADRSWRLGQGPPLQSSALVARRP